MSAALDLDDLFAAPEADLDDLFAAPPPPSQAERLDVLNRAVLGAARKLRGMAAATLVADAPKERLPGAVLLDREAITEPTVATPAAKAGLEPLAAPPGSLAPLAVQEEPVRLVPTQLVEETDEATRLKAVEDEVYEVNLDITRDTARFCEIGFDATEPPAAWVRELGMERALRRFRIAKGAQMAAKDAPVAIQMAARVVTGLAKARAMERSGGSKELNVQIVMMPQVFNYQSIEVAGRDD